MTTAHYCFDGLVCVHDNLCKCDCPACESFIYNLALKQCNKALRDAIELENKRRELERTRSLEAFNYEANIKSLKEQQKLNSVQPRVFYIPKI